MEPTLWTAPTPAPPNANWLVRALVAVVIERRLPYRVSLMVDRLANALGYRYKTVHAGGFSVRVRRQTSDEHFVQNIIVNHEYTGPGFEIQPTDTVIDIGGNVGTFSLFASGCASRGQVWTFEPEAANYSLLVRNIAANSCANVVVTHAAVAASRGTVRLFKADQGGFHSIVTDRAKDSQRFEDVPSIGLKDIFDEHRIERCHFLKLDCEGAEYDILYGLPAEYYARIDRIAMEYHGVEDRVARRRQSDGLIAHLEGMGFRIESYCEFGSTFRGGMIRASRSTDRPGRVATAVE
jgi:FkbM family methyltransferase